MADCKHVWVVRDNARSCLKCGRLEFKTLPAITTEIDLRPKGKTDAEWLAETVGADG
jgi:hypothetical protein